MASSWSWRPKAEQYQRWPKRLDDSGATNAGIAPYSNASGSAVALPLEEGG